MENKEINKEDVPLATPLIVHPISMTDYEALWQQHKEHLNWNCIFMLPFWLKTVCRHVGAPGKPTLLSVHQGSDLIGVAPLALSRRRASFLGDPSVCDYQDIVAAPGQAVAVMQSVQDYLADRGIMEIDLQTLRPDAAALKALDALTPRQGWQLHRLSEDVTYETKLPADWEAFLLQLNGKQRHEVRRKIRRLESQSVFSFCMTPNDGDMAKAADRFIQLFQMNRTDKADFMNPAMSGYFKALIQTLAEHDMLRLYFLDIGGQPAATVLCFDYQNVRYLYNSGYNAQYQKLSVGILSKVFSIQKGIDAGCRGYDFLKGAEVYKERTGGRQVGLFRYRLTRQDSKRRKA